MIPFVSLMIVVLSAGVAWLVWRGWEIPQRRLPVSPREHRALRYGLQQCSHGRGVAMAVSTPVAGGWCFAVHPAGALDRLAKWFRLAVEIKTGDPLFDRRFHVDSHDSGVHRLLADWRLRDRLMELEARLAARGGSLGRVAIEDGELRIELLAPRGDGGLELEAARHLGPLRDLVAAARPELGDTGSRERRQAVRCLFLVPWLIGTSAGSLLWELSAVRTFDRAALVAHGAIVGVALFAPFAAWALRYIGPSPRRHRLVFELLLIALPGFLFTAMLAMWTVNVQLDYAPPERVALDATVASGTQRKGPPRYDLILSPRLPEGTLQMRLDEESFRRLRTAWEGERGAAMLLMHPGRLGYRWVDTRAIRGRPFALATQVPTPTQVADSGADHISESH